MAQQQQSETELAGWLALFFPTVLTMIVRIGMGITDTAFVGHLAHDEAFPSATSVDFLSATSLALTWQGITSIICFNGGPPALSTLAGQAYGAGNLPLMGTWLHLSLIYSLVAALPVGVAWWYTGDVLRLALPRQACSDTCVQLAEAFSQRSLIWLYPTTAYFSFNTFLTCQKIVKPQMIISVAAAALNILLNYAFIYTLGWGYLGSPIATAATRWIYAFSLLVYIGANRERFEAMSVLSPDFAQVCSAARLKTFFAQAVPNQITAMLEQWQLQLISFFAGRLGEVDVATHNGLLNVYFFFSSFMFGMTNATSTRMAIHIGAGNITKAKHVLRIGLAAGLLIGTGVACGFALLRDWVGHIYSDSPTVWEATAPLCLLLAALYFLTAFLYTSFATIDAQGRPAVVAVAFVIGAWGVSVPLAYVLGFVYPKQHGCSEDGGYQWCEAFSKCVRSWETSCPDDDVVGSGSGAGEWRPAAGLGLFGLWLAMAAGYAVVGLIGGTAVITSDWPAIVVAAAKRVQKPEEETSSAQSNSAVVLGSVNAVNSPSGDKGLSTPLLS
jgi:MATE family multidrug resistance protein